MHCVWAHAADTLVALMRLLRAQYSILILEGCLLGINRIIQYHYSEYSLIVEDSGLSNLKSKRGKSIHRSKKH